jgi:transcriptional regulator NrdR family protein
VASLFCCPDCLATDQCRINSRRFRVRRLRKQNAVARAWKCRGCGAVFVTKEEVMYPTEDAIEEMSQP